MDLSCLERLEKLRLSNETPQPNRVIDYLRVCNDDCTKVVLSQKALINRRQLEVDPSVSVVPMTTTLVNGNNKDFDVFVQEFKIDTPVQIPGVKSGIANMEIDGDDWEAATLCINGYNLSTIVRFHASGFEFLKSGFALPIFEGDILTISVSAKPNSSCTLRYDIVTIKGDCDEPIHAAFPCTRVIKVLGVWQMLI